MPGARTHRARYRARARYRSLIVARSHAVLFSRSKKIENEDEHDSVSGSELKAGALEYGYLFNYHSLAISS
jgi:hypothetical protein